MDELTDKLSQQWSNLLTQAFIQVIRKDQEIARLTSEVNKLRMELAKKAPLSPEDLAIANRPME